MCPLPSCKSKHNLVRLANHIHNTRDPADRRKWLAKAKNNIS